MEPATILPGGSGISRKMLSAVSLEKKGFRQGSNRQLGAMQQQLSYLHSELRAPWLARTHVGYSL